MTNEELQSFVKLVYASYDRILVPKDLTDVCRAWKPFLQEFDLPTCEKVLPNICMQSLYLPKVWEIRIGVLNYLNKITPPPNAQEAWANYVGIMASMNNGASSDHSPHQVLVETMRALGKGAGNLNAQYDRKQFEAVYDSKLRQFQLQNYGI